MTHPYTIPNLLTLLRIVLIPVVVAFYADTRLRHGAHWAA
jgi:phosphatidylglycerophosphate synthase